MKAIKISPGLALILTLVSATGVKADNAVPTNSAPVQSVFILPATTKDGRDPFFPESTRLVAAPVAPTNHTVEISSIKVRGIFGAPGQMLAILNNHTFGAGEEGDVLSPNGRVHLRCLEIHDTYVIVSINGQLHRINYVPE
jgi:hypothetical protein